MSLKSLLVRRKKQYITHLHRVRDGDVNSLYLLNKIDFSNPEYLIRLFTCGQLHKNNISFYLQVRMCRLYKEICMKNTVLNIFDLRSFINKLKT